MKKFLRGAQAVRERVGAVESTTDTTYDELEREITRLKKAAKELPKTIEAMQDGVRKMWKGYTVMAREMAAVTTSLELSPMASDMSNKMVDIGANHEGAALDKLVEDINGSAVDILRRLEQDIKGLEHMRTERDKRRLEFGSVKEKLRKREEECAKKNKDIETDPKIIAIRIEVDAASKSYEVVNQRSIEAMTKVACVKDDVMKMTSYNIAQYFGEHLHQAAGALFEVKSVYETGQVGGTSFVPPPAPPAQTAAPEPTPAPAPAPAAPAPVETRAMPPPGLDAPPPSLGVPITAAAAAAGGVPPAPATFAPPPALGTTPPPALGTTPPPALGTTPPPVPAAQQAVPAPAPASGVSAYADVMKLGNDGHAAQARAAGLAQQAQTATALASGGMSIGTGLALAQQARTAGQEAQQLKADVTAEAQRVQAGVMQQAQADAAAALQNAMAQQQQQQQQATAAPAAPADDGWTSAAAPGQEWSS